MSLGRRASILGVLTALAIGSLILTLTIEEHRLSWGIAAAINTLAAGVWASHPVDRASRSPKKSPKINSRGGNA